MVWSTVWRKNGVRCATKQGATMCTMYEAGCDEAGAHHRDTAHIFTRAEPETAPGRWMVEQSLEVFKVFEDAEEDIFEERISRNLFTL